MSLYEGLMDDNDAVKTENSSSWNSSIELLKAQLRAKKVAQMHNEKKDKGGPVSSVTPVMDFKRRRKPYDGPEISFNSITGRMEVRELEGQIAVTDPFSSNEYDPLKPNDYERIKEHKRKLALKEKVEKKKKMEEADQARSDANLLKEKTTSMDVHQVSSTDFAAAAASPIGGAVQPITESNDDPSSSSSNMHGGVSQSFKEPAFGGAVVSRIMAKMGYREGQGLGKLNQGISQALSVEKTSKRCGKIVNEPISSSFSSSSSQATSAAESSTAGVPAETFRNPSKVILLRNMVGHGEVDEELEGETAEECGKYGRVRRVVIFEIPDAQDDEAVRIFVEFERIEASIKAVVDLNGRFFAGRTVKACFYNLDKFRQYVLGDDV